VVDWDIARTPAVVSDVLFNWAAWKETGGLEVFNRIKLTIYGKLTCQLAGGRLVAGIMKAVIFVDLMGMVGDYVITLIRSILGCSKMKLIRFMCGFFNVRRSTSLIYLLIQWCG
jgi:hypothetical protein